jgi:hypothetical protein
MFTYSSDERPLAQDVADSTSGEDEDDVDTLHHSQVIRHYWVRGDIRYVYVDFWLPIPYV